VRCHALAHSRDSHIRKLEEAVWALGCVTLLNSLQEQNLVQLILDPWKFLLKTEVCRNTFLSEIEEVSLLQYTQNEDSSE